MEECRCQIGPRNRRRGLQANRGLQVFDGFGILREGGVNQSHQFMNGKAVGRVG